MDVRLPDGTVIANVPDGTTQAQLMAQLAKMRAPESLSKTVAGGAIEPGLSILTGMVAQPIAGLAGIASGIGGGDAADTIRRVQSTLTYEPKTEGGKNATRVIGAPFELLSDLATSAGEKTSDATSPAVGAIVNTLINAAPAAVGIKGPSLGGGVSGAASRRLMQSALKPTVQDMRAGNADRAVQTMLDEGVNVSKGGLEKIEGRAASVNDLIAEAIANSNARVDKNSVANRLQDLIREREHQANPASDVSAITNADLEFRGHPLIPGNDMPVQLAQKIKQGTYKQLKDKYGEIGSADTEAQKTIARGLREEIAAAVPEVAPLNKREADLLNARNILERRVAVAGNANPLGIAAISPSAANIGGSLLDRSSIVKSLLARLMNPGKRGVSDQSVMLATAPQTFSDDARARQQVIDALMGR